MPHTVVMRKARAPMVSGQRVAHAWWRHDGAPRVEDRVVPDEGQFYASGDAAVTHHQAVEHLVGVALAVVDVDDPGADHNLLLGPGRPPMLDLRADVDGRTVGEVVTGQGG